MSMTSRERVIKCLNFETPDRMPREIWCLPYAVKKYPEIIKEISRKYPSDFGGAGNVYRKFGVPARSVLVKKILSLLSE